MAFGAGSGSTPGFSFGSSGTSTGFAFGNTNTSNTSASTLLTAPQTATATGFAFGSTTSAASTASLSTPTLAKSLFGAKTATATTTAGFTAPTTTTSIGLGLLSSQPTSKAQFKGLGGVEVVSSNSSSNGNPEKSGVISQAVKDQTVPEEICKDVAAFESYVSKQKEESNEVAKFSVRSLHKISDEINNLTVSLALLAFTVQRNKAMVEKLRGEFGEQLKHAEMAQRTQNTPTALQHDNISPIQYFIDLVSTFDSSMQLYRQQIDELENHLHSLSQSNVLTPQDVSMTLLKMQDSFITLASNLHSLHDGVKRLKEQYLAYRRVVHGDSVDLFATKTGKKIGVGVSTPLQGPSPFQNLSNVAALAMATMMQQPQPRQQAPPQQSMFNKPMFGPSTTTNIFGGTTTSTSGLFGAKPTSTTSSSLFPSSGSVFGTSSLKPTLSAGFNPSTSSNVFFGNSTYNSSAGVTFGGSAAKNQFDLKPPPAPNKKNKKFL